MIVKRHEEAKGFTLLKWRWIVERTFGWFGRFRRLAKDYEQRPDSEEAFIRIAMIRIMISRLAHPRRDTFRKPLRLVS